MKAFVPFFFAVALSLPVTAAEPLAFNNSRHLSAEAEGLTMIARELATDATCITKRVVAVINNSTTAEAADIRARKWVNDYTKIEMLDHPSRTGFELTVSPLGHAFESGPFSVIEWTTDFASNTTESGKPSAFGHKFNHHREAVMAKPLTNAAIICFVPPLKDKDGSLTKSINILPSGSLDALGAAVAWRSSHLDLFRPKEAMSDDAITALRAELVNTNPYVRLAVMLQLIKIAKFDATDVATVIKAAVKPVELAAATILIITDAPGLVTAIVDALGDPASNREAFDGVVIGAASHFLNLSESERLLGAARAFQIVRSNSPNLPEALSATVSFPLLLKLADTVTGKDGKTTIEVPSLLFKLLKASAALRR